MASFSLVPNSTALVLIDLQKGITSFPIEPRPSGELLHNAGTLADRFRQLGAPVFPVHLAFPTGEAALHLMTEAKPALPATEPPGWHEPALELQESDISILKRQWGAFYGTELGLQQSLEEKK
jgi:nicotinamidase-related amidase